MLVQNSVQNARYSAKKLDLPMSNQHKYYMQYDTVRKKALILQKPVSLNLGCIACVNRPTPTDQRNLKKSTCTATTLNAILDFHLHMTPSYDQIYLEEFVASSQEVCLTWPLKLLFQEINSQKPTSESVTQKNFDLVSSGLFCLLKHDCHPCPWNGYELNLAEIGYDHCFEDVPQWGCDCGCGCASSWYGHADSLED